MSNRLLLLAALTVALASALTGQAGQSTFGHARSRELAELGRLPTSHDLVVRDIVNYRQHRLPLPSGKFTVAIDARFDRTTAMPGQEVWLQLGYATRSEGDRTLSPPCSVALVIDCSGSMQERGKMSQVQAGLNAFVQRLRPDDHIALIAFSAEARVVSSLRRRGDGHWLQAAIHQLQPDGSTNLHAGLMLGLRELRNSDAGHRSQRVLLLTDGIANAGVTQAVEIAAASHRLSGDAIDISTIGVGQNLDTALLRQLAETNHGLFHLVASHTDIQKVFVREADSMLVPVARDAVLTATLPAGLRNVRVFGEQADVRGNQIQVRLPTLNAGVTGVVLVRATVAGGFQIDGNRADEYWATDLLQVNAALTTTSASDPEERSAQYSQAQLRIDPHQAQIDVEVRKNVAIALLADGLGEMAKACDGRRWADADRILRRASDRARSMFPGEDVDVQRVRDLVTGHQQTLQRYVTRFRSF